MAEDEPKSLRFGWLTFRPRYLQLLNTPRWFLFFICTYFFTQSIVVNGVYPVSITTIEKRYGYSSLMTGLLTSTYDIAALLLTAFVSYLGATRKKPLICGTGMFIMGLGFFVFTLPHFMSGKYEYGNPLVTTSNLCDDRNITLSHEALHCAEEGSRSHWGYLVLFIVGMGTIGMGATPLWNLGTSYMDENVKAKVAPMYIGIFYCSGVIGAGVGFVLGGIFLSMYIDIGAQTSLTPKDEAWAGAWWLGFLVGTVCCIFWSVWLVAFPKEFPKTKELRMRQKENENHPSALNANAGYVKLKDLPKATKVIMLRVPFSATTLAMCVDTFLVASLTAFMPKVIEQQFRFTASFVSVIMGGVIIPAALSGTYLGSYVCKKLQVDLLGAAKMCYMVSAATLAACCLLFLYCDTILIAGVNTLYINSTSEGVSSLCNAHCACSSVEYSPVCSNGVTYFSPCHAGCTMGNYIDQTFSNCSCLNDGVGSLGSVTAGSCASHCGLVKPLFFLFVYFLVVFSTFFATTPGTIVTLRCVPKDQRAYALGIQACVVRLLGSTPGPVVLGSLIDTTCILWHKGCGGEGNCLEYNNKSLMLVVLVMNVVGKSIATVFYVIARLFCPKNQPDNDVRKNSDRQEIKAINSDNDTKSNCNYTRTTRV